MLNFNLKTERTINELSKTASELRKETEAFQKENEYLKKRLSAIIEKNADLFESIQSLLSIYTKNVYEKNALTYPDNVCWQFSDGSAAGVYDDGMITVNCIDGSVSIIKTDRITLSSGSNKVDEKADLEVCPPLDDFVTLEDKQINNDDYKISVIYNDKWKKILDELIDAARKVNYDTAYLNSDGTFAAPFNLKGNVLGCLTENDRPMSLDDFDELADLIIDDYGNVEVDEDANQVVFHLS